MDVKSLRSSGTGSRRGLKRSNLGPGVTDRVTTDSRKATFDPREASLSEDLLDGLSRSHGSVAEERHGIDHDPHKEWAKRLHLLFGKSDEVDRSPLNTLRVEKLVDSRAVTCYWSAMGWS